MTLRHSMTLLWLLLAGGLHAQPVDIDRFDVTIQLDPDGSFTVTETIVVDFHELQRHGIYRTIPVNYGRGSSSPVCPSRRAMRYGFTFSAWPTERGARFPTTRGLMPERDSSASAIPIAP